VPIGRRACRRAPCGKLPWFRTIASIMAEPARPASTSPGADATRSHYDVRRADLPLSCPLPSMAVWNEHPRVYLSIVEDGGRSKCPYCGTTYVLVD